MELSAISPSLVAALQEIKAGDKILVKIVIDNELSQLSIYATEFKLRENHYTLVSLTNIQSELEEREMEAWQNLIRVLTHEIMNSVTPLVSLSSSASSLLDSAIGVNDNTDMKPDTGNAKSDSQSTGADSPSVEINAESLQDIKGALIPSQSEVRDYFTSSITTGTLRAFLFQISR